MYSWEMLDLVRASFFVGLPRFERYNGFVDGELRSASLVLNLTGTVWLVGFASRQDCLIPTSSGGGR